MVSHEKKGKCRRYPIEIITDSDDADGLVLLANTHAACRIT